MLAGAAVVLVLVDGPEDGGAGTFVIVVAANVAAGAGAWLARPELAV